MAHMYFGRLARRPKALAKFPSRDLHAEELAAKLRRVLRDVITLHYCIETKPRGALQGAPRYYFGALQGAQ